MIPDAHDELAHHHRQCEGALRALYRQGMVGTTVWESMSEAEREHREERVNRVLMRHDR